MRIDIHAHYFPAEYISRLDLYGASHVTNIIWKANLASPDSSGLDAHFRNMELANVDMQILSVSGQLPYFANENEAVEAARLANDLYARVVREHPKRFAAFACAPLPHVRASIDEPAVRSTNSAWLG